MRFLMPVRRRSSTWTLFSLALVALLAALFNPPDPAVTSPDIEYVQRVVDGDTLVFGTANEFDSSVLMMILAYLAILLDRWLLGRKNL